MCFYIHPFILLIQHIEAFLYLLLPGPSSQTDPKTRQTRNLQICSRRMTLSPCLCVSFIRLRLKLASGPAPTTRPGPARSRIGLALLQAVIKHPCDLGDSMASVQGSVSIRGNAIKFSNCAKFLLRERAGLVPQRSLGLAALACCVVNDVWIQGWCLVFRTIRG